ncbi:MAG: anaerobic ribonucleoside-triphosphate reductase activating protein [Clostridia bacterium]|nr:anaerobic ribonucleoside-triphosphate reductase activating protein [Clostridia bacterium]
MEIRIAGIVNDSIVDGPGNRLTVFVQGCPHHCPGCHNPDSHDFSGGRLTDTGDILRQIRANPLLDGITLSGGEPMCQPEACLLLAREARLMGLNVWCYTGYTLEALLAEHEPARMALLEAVDVLVDGPFLLRQRSLDLLYCGSRNQRLLDVRKSLAAHQPVLWERPAVKYDWDNL